MEGMIMTAQLLLSLSILIVVHEWGHYFTARMFNIKVEKFYLFFDFLFPMANVLNFSLLKYKKGDTEYGIGWFPLGGYVKIAGMVDESMDKDQLKAEPQPWEFRSKPAWQRLIVMMGGIIVNVIVGVLIFIGITYFIGDTTIPKEYLNNNGGIFASEIAQKLGLKTGDKIIKVNNHNYKNLDDLIKPEVLLGDTASYTILRDGREILISLPEDFLDIISSKKAIGGFITFRIPAIVGKVREKSELVFDERGEIVESNKPLVSVAKNVGLKPDDKFIELEGIPVHFYDEVSGIIKAKQRDSISFKIKRGSEVLEFKEPFKNQAMIGFAAKEIKKEDLTIIKYSLAEAIPMGATKAFEVIWLQIKGFGKLLTGKVSVKNSLSGPVGMAKMYGGVWDWERFWRMTGLLSMVLAFMNFLPIPALDGGYVMFLLYEMISGREPSEKFFENAIKVGMAILLLLMVFVFYNDIAKAITGG